MLRCRAVRQDVNPSGSRIKHAAAVAHRRHAGQIEARGEQLVAIRVGYDLHHIAGQIHDTDVRLVVPEIGQEERVVRRVRADEEQAGGELAPGAADCAEAAELLGGQPQQDIAQQVRGQHAGARIGWPERMTAPATPSTKPRDPRATRIETVMPQNRGLVRRMKRAELTW